MRRGIRFDDYYMRHVVNPADPVETGSSWFTSPAESYDERLLSADGQHLRPDVREWIISQFHGFLEQSGYRYPQRWTAVWIAGSGVTRQWSAHAGGAGDLDILIGVNWAEFFRHHPEWRGTPSEQVAGFINQQMHGGLWLEDWHGVTGDYDEPFDVTFYINPQSSDIRDLKPYAAFNVTTDTWDVDPLELPDDWEGDNYVHYQRREAIERELAAVRDQVQRYREAVHALENTPPGPRSQDAQRRAALLADQLAARWQGLREDRKRAFGIGGEGFYDWESYRWQSYKRSGLSKVLREVSAGVRSAREERELALYGSALVDPDQARTAAARSQQR